MKITCHREHGTALLAMIVLISVMITITISNSQRLILLKREIRLVDQRQQQKFTKKVPGQIPPTPEKQK
jgi:hypothetical protein